MIKFSHSKLDVIRSCMKKYHFKYEIKLKVKEDQVFSEFGSFIHDIAEHYKGGGKKELLKLAKKLKKKWKFPMEDYKERVKIALKNVHDFWEKNLKGVKPEHILTEKDLTVDVGDFATVTGKIDLIIIDEKTGKFRIIDFKTNKSKKYSDHSNQLAMYMYLAHTDKDLQIDYEDMECEIVYLSLLPEEKDGTPVENVGYENICKKYDDVDDSDVELLVEEIEAINDRIARARKNDKWSSKPGWFNCTFCPFSEHCEEKYVDEKND